MSRLSNWLQKRGGISKEVQRGVMGPISGVVRSIPGASVAMGAADLASRMFGGGGPGRGVQDVGGFGLPGDWGAAGRGLFGSSGRIKAENGMCPRGYHLNKSRLSDGTNPRSVCVRNRHMNPLNGRAAMRSIRRLKRANKLVRKITAFSGARRSGGGSGHRRGCRCVACKNR